jgi:hypothetical protein
VSLYERSDFSHSLIFDLYELEIRRMDLRFSASI